MVSNAIQLSTLTARCNPLQREQANESIEAIIEALTILQQQYGPLFFAPLRRIADMTGLGLKTVSKWMNRMRQNEIIERICNGTQNGPRSTDHRAAIYSLLSDTFTSVVSLLSKWGNTDNNIEQEKEKNKNECKYPDKFSVSNQNLENNIDNISLSHDEYMQIPCTIALPSLDDSEPARLLTGPAKELKFQRDLASVNKKSKEFIAKSQASGREWTRQKGLALLDALKKQYRRRGLAQHPWVVMSWDQAYENHRALGREDIPPPIYKYTDEWDWWKLFNMPAKYGSLREKYIDPPQDACPTCRDCSSPCMLFYDHYKREARFGNAYWKCLNCKRCDDFSLCLNDDEHEETASERKPFVVTVDFLELVGAVKQYHVDAYIKSGHVFTDEAIEYIRAKGLSYDELTSPE